MPRCVALPFARLRAQVAQHELVAGGDLAPARQVLLASARALRAAGSRCPSDASSSRARRGA